MGLERWHVIIAGCWNGNKCHMIQMRTQGAEHGPAGVDGLNLPVAGEGLRVGRQAGCVPAVVAGELAVQVRRRLSEVACGGSASCWISTSTKPRRSLPAVLCPSLWPMS